MNDIWYYKNKEFNSADIGDYIGFVYVVTNKETNKKYVGKKKFKSTTKKPPLKGYKRKRTIIKESDWKTYCGSSEEVKQIVKESPDLFDKEIIRLCSSLGEMSYHEMKYQIENDVLLKPDEWYNAFVGGKIHRNHLKNLIK